MAVGVWEDGRIGTFRGIRDRPHAATAPRCSAPRRSCQAGGFEGYEPLIVEIVKFFKTGKPPVAAEETLEIFAFMEAADESKRQGGCPVTIESVMEKARQANAQEMTPAQPFQLASPDTADRESLSRHDAHTSLACPACVAWRCLLTSARRDGPGRAADAPAGPSAAATSSSCTTTRRCTSPTAARCWAGPAGPTRSTSSRPTPRACGCSATSVGFLTEFRGMIDFSDDFLDAACRNFAGEPFIVPWLWDHKHKGQPA